MTNGFLYFIPMLIGIIIIGIGTFRPVFGDWNKPILSPLNVSCLVVGFIIVITTGVIEIQQVEKDDKANTLYFTSLKENIRNMDCKNLGSYIINNSDNSTLINNQIIDLAHNVYGVKCHA